MDPEAPFDDQIGELKAPQEEGGIRAVGLSEVDVPQIEASRRTVEIASVHNLYNLYNLESRGWDEVVDYCARERIAFIPWFPVMSGDMSSDSAVAEVAAATGAASRQIALAWLLARADVVLPIPEPRPSPLSRKTPWPLGWS